MWNGILYCLSAAEVHGVLSGDDERLGVVRTVFEYCIGQYVLKPWVELQYCKMCIKIKILGRKAMVELFVDVIYTLNLSIPFCFINPQNPLVAFA